MTSDIITSFELDKISDSSKVIIIKEINGCDSSFISSCVLGNCIKNKSAVLIVLIHNSFSHYHNVGLKMNYNLQKSLESGLVDFYDVGGDLVNTMLENKCTSSLDMWFKIKEKLVKLHEKHAVVNVIFEGISHLFDMQFTLKEVNDICKNVIDLIRSYNNSSLFVHCNVANEDDITNVLANSLSHKAQILAEVENLPSGLSADVSGRLTLKYLYHKYQSENIYTYNQKPSQYLFRLFDRGVKLLAPGTV